MSQKQLKEVPIKLMEQIHYILKARIIKDSTVIQRQRTQGTKVIEIELKKKLVGTLTQAEERETRRNLT